MDKREARTIIAAQLEPLRQLSYQELVERLLDRQETSEVVGASGAWYQLEIYALWDDRPGGVLRVWGAIDDGGWRAFAPLVECFLISPDGSFVGE
jgi:hypothetical protein